MVVKVDQAVKLQIGQAIKTCICTAQIKVKVVSFDSTHTPPTLSWQSRVKALLASDAINRRGPKMALIEF